MTHSENYIYIYIYIKYNIKIQYIRFRIFV